MAYRLIECTLADHHMEKASEMIEERKPIHTWSDFLEEEGMGQLKVLLEVEKTEELMDALSDQFSGSENFRLILMNVQATLPRPEIDEEEEVEKEEQEETTTSGRISREELYTDVVEGSRLTKVYVATIVLSVLVAAVGLIQGNTAVIIGAMVIAPLLGPNVSLTLGLTLGDLKLVWRSLKTGGVGIVMALIVSLLIGFFFTVNPSEEEIAIRTLVGLGDLVVALAAGSAGVLAFTRGLPSAIIGVMVAVALLPPLANLGLLLGSGYYAMAFGAFVLLITNLICINLAGILTFLVQGIRPRKWWEEEKASRYIRTAVTIWVLLLAVFVAVILVWW